MWQLTDRVGIGWRDALAAQVFAHVDNIEIIEITAEDWFGASAGCLRSLRSLARELSLSVHGVTLGLGSVVPTPESQFTRLARLVDRLQPATYSEHLAFVRGGGFEIGHLAAPPRNANTACGAAHNIDRLRRCIGVAPLLENIATLIDPPGSTWSESRWINEIAKTSDASLLLDLHNLYANAMNFGHDPLIYLQRFPLHRVQQIHLSGGRWIECCASAGLHGRRLLDDHRHDVPDEVFHMLAVVAEQCPQPLSVILERDGNYPKFSTLLEQLMQARRALARGRQRAADARAAAAPMLMA